MHVVYLKNAEAVKLAQVLRAVVLGEAGVANQASNLTGGITTTQTTPQSQATLSASPVNTAMPTTLATSNVANQAPLAARSR